MRSASLANTVAKLALTKKAQDVVVMDLRPLTSMTDFFVVCSADSDIQVKAIADAVIEGTEKNGNPPWHKETRSPNWVLLDYSDVVLHVFHKTARSFYNLERLWGDATFKRVTDEPRTATPRKQRTARIRKVKRPAARRTSGAGTARKKAAR